MTSPFWHLVLRAFNTYTYAIVFTLVPLFAGIALFKDNTTAAHLLSTILGVAMHAMLTYTTFWGTAERDRNLVLYGHIKEDKWRAVKASLCASIPLFLLTVLAVLNTYFVFLPQSFTPIYRICTLPYLYFVTAATTAPVPGTAALLLIVLPGPIMAGWGYYNGYRLFRLRDKIIYKSKPREKDKRLR